jgi:hypothetical protein
MKATLIRLTSMAALVVTGLCQAKPPEVPADWKTECVGNFNISVPGEVDIALLSPHSDPRLDGAIFSYNRGPSFSRLVNGGVFHVSDEVPYEFFLKKRNEDVKELDKRLDGDFKYYDVSRDDFFSSTFEDSESKSISSYRWVANRMYFHEAIAQYNFFSKDQVDTFFSEFVENFRPRGLYEIPKEKGYCIPYGFVKSAAPRNRRKLAMSMVLKDHPDVTIELQERGISPGTKDRPSEKETIHKFWKYDAGGYAEKLQTLGFPSFRSVKMGGQKGLAVFVEITLPVKCVHGNERYTPDETFERVCFPPQVINYGYMAEIKGEASAKEDKPNLTLLVRQESEYGPNGKPTISKDELRVMAETIAASVTRR